MITPADYFKAYAGHADITPDIEANAEVLLVKVNSLLEACILSGFKPTANPATGTLISGQNNGGWRPPECAIGAPSSAHKTGEAVDIYDPENELEVLIGVDELTRHGLYKEHPNATPRWLHLGTRAPRSGNRIFMP